MKLQKLLLVLLPMIISSCGSSGSSSQIEPSKSAVSSSEISSIKSSSTTSSVKPSSPSSKEEPSSSKEPSSSVKPSSSELPPSSSQGPALTTVTTEQALNYLKSSYFSDPIRTEENLGLSEMHNVGVDKDRYENEVLYEVPVGGAVYNVADYDVTPEGTNNTFNLNAMLASIKAVEGVKIIQFQKGIYNFKGTITMDNFHDIYFVGDETEWRLSTWNSFFSVSNSTNFHINNIDFDILPSPTISGVIKEYQFNNDGNCEVTLTVPDEFDLSSSVYSQWSYSSMTNCYGSYMECSLDPITGKYTPDINKNLIYNTTNSVDSYKGMKAIKIQADKHEVTVTLGKDFAPWSLRTPTVGDHVSLAFTMYNFFGFLFTQCKEVYVEHVNCYVTAGMGIRFNGGANAYLNKFNFCQRPGSERIMTCTADIIHSASLKGELKITNCLLEGSHDDALNIKTYYCSVNSVVKSANEITVGQTQNEVATEFEVGDKIDVYDPSTLGYIDSYTVKSFTKSGTTYTLTLDRRPKNIIEGYIVGNDNKATHLSLDNCVIANKRNRGILLQARYSEIVNCCFSNVIMGATNILAVNDSFAEAIAPRHCVFKNNKFIDCRGGDLCMFAYGNKGAAVGTVGDFVCENNFLYNNNGSPFWLKSCEDTTVKNNLVYYPGSFSRKVVTVEYSKNVTIQDNVLYTDGTHSYAKFISIDAYSSDIYDINNVMLGGN